MPAHFPRSVCVQIAAHNDFQKRPSAGPQLIGPRFSDMAMKVSQSKGPVFGTRNFLRPRLPMSRPLTFRESSEIKTSIPSQDSGAVRLSNVRSCPVSNLPVPRYSTSRINPFQ